MNPHLYFDGRQIKNYLVGFASLFSEIPYKNRAGKIDIVPIHYGSPSDIISHLEMNVDNDETKNRNRLKDVNIPLFSFRMTGIDRNLDKRRAPHNTITVDLRPLGYSVGYVTMKPAPYKFTMELICWASSDYQAFEITEQIIPYFNSPQQVTIEPLPRSPVSTTEVFLDNITIETEPESQKYSALITMTFSLNGWLLTQPKIWSTNMKFELSMLDKDYKNKSPNTTENLCCFVGHDIVEENKTSANIIPSLKTVTFDTLFTYIKTTKLKEIYFDKFVWYEMLINNNRIDSTGHIVDNTSLSIDYNGTTKILDISVMEMLVDDILDVKYLYTNDKLANIMQEHSFNNDVEILKLIFMDTTNTVDVYLKLLDYNLVTKGFNKTDVHISNSDKLNIFGTPRIDIEEILERLRLYLACIENIRLQKEWILTFKNVNNDGLQLFFDTKLTEIDKYLIAVLLDNKIKTEKNVDTLIQIVDKKYNHMDVIDLEAYSEGLKYISSVLQDNLTKKIDNPYLTVWNNLSR